MFSKTETILHIPEIVREETLNYRGKVEGFLNGDTLATGFKACHVSMGIYEQRTAGKYMVRIRIPAGLVTALQLRRIAELSKKYGNGILHVTTRQDIQIHGVKIEDTPNVVEELPGAGLSSCGTGGNSVRNITCCPESGACAKEEFDVTPYSVAVAEYLLQDKGSFNLPRKYKIVFSGCRQDCAYASVADLGFFAHKKDGVKGFAVYAAGGLGANPAVAVKIEDFIKADEVFEVAEAVKRLFDKHGDRSNRNKARLRYVLARVGDEEFIRLYQKERETVKVEGLSFEVPDIRDISSSYPVAEGAVTVGLRLKNGDIAADDLARVGQIAARYGQGLVRATQLQDLLITGVEAVNVDKVNGELRSLGTDVFCDGQAKVVACTGAATCKLGLCLSGNLSEAISNRLSRNNLPDTIIRISGCHNSCGQHHIAETGFQGRIQMVNGKRMPCYDVLVGARIVEGNARLAEKIGTVPAKVIPDLLAQAVNNGRIEKDLLKSLVARYSDIGKEPLPEDYYLDWGSDKVF
jgi:sulfite reductase (ferredoxin)